MIYQKRIILFLVDLMKIDLRWFESCFVFALSLSIGHFVHCRLVTRLQKMTFQKLLYAIRQIEASRT